MIRGARFGRASCAALALLAAGCGAKLGESEGRERSEWLLLAEPSSRDFAYDALARHRNAVDHAWQPPRPVEGGGEWTREPHAFRASTLVRVELTLYPEVSCEGTPTTRHVQRAFPDTAARPPALSRAELAALGAPTHVVPAWMLPAALAAPGPWDVGPAWFGNFLREAGAGNLIYFPPHQECAAPSIARPETLPTQVFMRGGKVTLGARVPFTARIVEACPAELTRRDRTIVSWHIPLGRAGYGPDVGFRDERTATTARLVARCAAGEARFELGPFESGGAANHPEPGARLVARLPGSPAAEPVESVR